MKNFIFLLLIFLFGCASSLSKDIQSVKDCYEKVDLKRGVSIEDAKVIAQKEVINKNFQDLYDFKEPKIDDDVSDLPNNQKYWFIYFKEINKSSIPFVFMVVVNKETGKIKFADDYIKEKKWILESALLQ